MSKKIIDIDTWKGKKHYLWFKEYAHPYYSVTTKLDITVFYHYIKEKELPFFASFMYLVVKAFNSIEEFRLRMDHDQVVLFDEIHPAFTVMTDEGIFDNCDIEITSFNEYLPTIKKRLQEAKIEQNKEKNYNDNRLDQYYISSVPWIDFTGATHPMTDDRTDSIPRIVWGKYYMENDKVMIAFNVQVNHALIDGYPLSKGILTVQEYINNPKNYLI